MYINNNINLNSQENINSTDTNISSKKVGINAPISAINNNINLNSQDTNIPSKKIGINAPISTINDLTKTKEQTLKETPNTVENYQEKLKNPDRKLNVEIEKNQISNNINKFNQNIIEIAQTNGKVSVVQKNLNELKNIFEDKKVDIEKNNLSIEDKNKIQGLLEKIIKDSSDISYKGDKIYENRSDNKSIKPINKEIYIETGKNNYTPVEFPNNFNNVLKDTLNKVNNGVKIDNNSIYNINEVSNKINNVSNKINEIQTNLINEKSTELNNYSSKETYSKNESYNFGKDSKDFSKSNFNNLLGSFAYSQANINQDTVVRLLKQ